jgi:hypothetical protein
MIRPHRAHTRHILDGTRSRQLQGLQLFVKARKAPVAVKLSANKALPPGKESPIAQVAHQQDRTLPTRDPPPR